MNILVKNYKHKKWKTQLKKINLYQLPKNKLTLEKYATFSLKQGAEVRRFAYFWVF